MPRTSLQSGSLVFIAAIVGIGALKIGYPVLMPMVVAIFVIATAWPVREWLHARLPRALSYVCTIAVLFLLVGTFFVIIGFAFDRVLEAFLRQQDRLRDLYNEYESLARDLGLPTPLGAAGDGASNFDRILSIGRALLAEIYAAASYTGIVSVIVILGFPEVPALTRRFRHQFGLDRGGDPSRVIAMVDEIARGFRRYLAMTLVASLITGLASGLWAYAAGLDMALIWGLLNFLLNFIPVIGNIVGVVPPTLYAVMQFEGWTMPAIVLAGFLALQLVISNFVYPLLQSRGLAMPPVTVILALLFWGWAWGFIGALFAVPLTAAIITILAEFPRTKPLAAVLGSSESRDGAE